MNVTVYTRLHCGACLGTKKFLETRGIPFEENNVELDELRIDAQKLVDEGFRAMPVVKVTYDSGATDAWAGMNLSKLKEVELAFSE